MPTSIHTVIMSRRVYGIKNKERRWSKRVNCLTISDIWSCVRFTDGSCTSLNSTITRIFPFCPFQTALLNIVLRDSFAAPEKDIFLALLNWCKHNSKENHAEIMQAVRLPLMSLTELLNVVRPSGLLSPDAILDAIKVRSESRDMDLNYRGMLSKYPLSYSHREILFAS